jgi:pyrroline-5-carboxylate reductase
MKYKKIAILGGGNLGASIVQGLLNANAGKAQDITVTRRKLHLLDYLKEKGVNITDDNRLAVRNSDIILITVKPHQTIRLLKEIAEDLDPSRHLLISAVTGISISEIEEVTGSVPVFRAMPNTAIALNESMTCISGTSSNKELGEVVLSLFESLGKTAIINEELMGAATVLGACGVAFALRFMRAVSQGGIEIGFGAELAQLISAQTIKGAARLILESGNHPEKEIDKVTTPMGITISGLNEMEHQGFSPAIIRGLLTSYNKLQKMNDNKYD